MSSLKSNMPTYFEFDKEYMDSIAVIFKINLQYSICKRLFMEFYLFQ